MAAVRPHRLAAELSNPEAQSSVGCMLHEGLGAPRNHLEAVLWYCLAAETDYAAAQTNMGLVNREGLGVPERDVLQ